MKQTFYGITPVDVTPGTAGSWQDVDVSAYVPAGATGVLLHVTNKTNDYNYYVGLRKNGSTDSRTGLTYIGSHSWAAIGIDSNRIFEAIAENAARIDIWLVGYTLTGVTFFTNAYDKSLSATAAWTDIDCSVEAPGAVGLIFEYHAIGGNGMGMRKNGSTDNRYVYVYYRAVFGIIIGCDTGQIVEGEIQSTDADFYLVGYITDGAAFNTNATDVTISGGSAVWVDLAALPTDSVVGFIEVDGSSSGYIDYGLRKNGSAENINLKAGKHPWAFVECDSNGIIEARHHSAVNLFVVGYAASAFIPKVFIL